MSKNIVVFSDGTCQEGGKGNNTNVYKLFNMVEDRTRKQIAFYDRGVGTDWRKITGSLSGSGISKNIKDCYRFIFENFEAEDKIYLFGFSRGATTVRSLSGFIHLFGILPESRPELINKAYRIYKIRNKKMRERKAKEFISKHHTMWTKIQMIGVWDTVAALGTPIKLLNYLLNLIPFFKYKFHDLNVCQSVISGYHALAIDEKRKVFGPVIWENKKTSYQKIEQVWFSGSHTDIGGGYKEHELSNISLNWMIANGLTEGLRIYLKNQVQKTIKPDPDGIIHDSSKTLLGRLSPKEIRSWNKERSGELKIHESALQRQKNILNKSSPPYHPWIHDEARKIVKTKKHKNTKKK